MSAEIRPGTRVRCRDAFGEWREKIATSEVEGRRDASGHIQHDFEGVYVSSDPADGGVFWPIEDVEIIGMAASGVSPDE